MFTDLQPFSKEVFVQQGHKAGGGQHALPVHHPVKRLHLLLVRVDNQLLQTQSCGRRPDSSNGDKKLERKGGTERLHCFSIPMVVTDEDIPNFGMMFFTIKASHAPGVKTSFHGCRMSRADVSLGCHRCNALDSLLLMGGYRGSRRDWSRGSHGWIQEWMGTVSVRGFQLSTYYTGNKETTIM